MNLPPLDVHAHVSTDIAPIDLEHLGAVVLIATRSTDEFSLVESRNDQVSVWGVGCHPSLVGVQRDFDVAKFSAALSKTPFVAEVGLDGSSRVSMEDQRVTLMTILEQLNRSPRLVSLHSYKASQDLLDLTQVAGNAPGRILHWWLGNEAATKRAVDFGFYFSVNFSMVRGSDSWKLVPLERLLVETDHPAGDRFSPSPRQPGRVQPVEDAIARHHGITKEAVRRQVWKNFADLVEATSTRAMFPAPVRRMLDVIASH